MLGRLDSLHPESPGGKVKRIVVILLALLAVSAKSAEPAPASAMKVGVVGLVHDHVGAFFKGGALAPAGGILNRADVQVVGIVEPDQKLFDSTLSVTLSRPTCAFAALRKWLHGCIHRRYWFSLPRVSTGESWKSALHWACTF